MGILCPVILPATCVVPPRNTKFAQRRAVGSELVGHDGDWSDALLLQEFSHQLERRLAVSPWLNEDVQDLAFAVHGTPDVQLSAVETPLLGTFSGIRTGSLGAGSVGVGVGLGTTTGLGIVSGISMGSEPG